jgi:hypothetical protein
MEYSAVEIVPFIVAASVVGATICYFYFSNSKTEDSAKNDSSTLQIEDIRKRRLEKLKELEKESASLLNEIAESQPKNKVVSQHQPKPRIAPSTSLKRQNEQPLTSSVTQTSQKENKRSLSLNLNKVKIDSELKTKETKSDEKKNLEDQFPDTEEASVVDTSNLEIDKSVEETVQQLPLNEEEQIKRIFGHQILINNSTSTAIAAILLTEPSTVRALNIAAGWWNTTKAIDCLEEWKETIFNSVQKLLQQRMPEEDLFTDNPIEEVSAILLEFLGYRISSGKRIQFTFESVQTRSSSSSSTVNFIALDPEYVRLVAAADTKSMKIALQMLFDTFSDYSLTMTLQEYLGETILRQITTDKSLAAAVGYILEYETLQMNSLRTCSEIERNSIFSALFRISTIVPYHLLRANNSINNRNITDCLQLRYFEHIPLFPNPTRLWTSNDKMLKSTSSMLQRNALEVYKFTASIIQLSLKQKLFRDSVLMWMAKYIELSHTMFFAAGEETVNNMTNNMSTSSSSFVLHLSYVILLIIDPFFKDEAAMNKFIHMISWEYVLTDDRIQFSNLSNMFDGMKVTRSANDNTTNSEASYNFATEIFWITMRSLELVNRIYLRRQKQINELFDEFSTAKQLYESNATQFLPRIESAKQQLHLLHYGWSASVLEDSQYLTIACRWAKAAADWIILQAQQPNASNTETRFHYIPASLAKAMCHVWQSARNIPREGVMTSAEARHAALFCVELMNRPDLVRSPVLLDRLLSVLELFVHVFGSQQKNGVLAGIVMENEMIRTLLVPAILSLYSTCHAVAALDVNEDSTFDKSAIRHRANELLVALLQYPLPEPRHSLLTYLQRDRGQPFQAFILSALDCIVFSFESAVTILRRIHSIESQQQQQQSLGSSTSTSTTTAAPIPPLYLNQARSTLQTTASTFYMLAILCDTDKLIQDTIVSCSGLFERVAISLYTCLLLVNNEEKLEKIKVTSTAIRTEQIIQQQVRLLVTLLTGQSQQVQEAFIRAMMQHPDYDITEIEVLSNLAGGSSLQSLLSVFRSVAEEEKQKPDNQSSNKKSEIDWEEWRSGEVDADAIYKQFFAEHDTVRYIAIIPLHSYIIDC